MIPQAYLAEWRSVAPWKSVAQVEQDLIMCRADAASMFAGEVLSVSARSSVAGSGLHASTAASAFRQLG